MNRLAQLDHRYVWHPFTQMRDWLRCEPIVIESGRGAILRDIMGTEYLDANSSIWTNLHGHNHPAINSAIRRQLNKIAHSSSLGLANEPASLLAETLVKLANPGRKKGSLAATQFPKRGSAASVPGFTDSSRRLVKVFFSDDGSTAMEVALKLAYETSRRENRIAKPKFLSMDGAYHGDTIGAASLGHIDLFHRTYGGLLFKSDKVMAPYCYRCPFNRARPDRADARDYRQCNWECVDRVEQKFAVQKKHGSSFSAFVVEPLIQGAAGMIPQPEGWLQRTVPIARGHGTRLIADEVMTGFGRTGTALTPNGGTSDSAFACQRAGVAPDFLCLAKGLTGGYLPMAATLTTQTVFDAFLGDYDEFKTFFHGHSYTANPVGASAALASLKLLQNPGSISRRRQLEETLRDGIKVLWKLPVVGDVRQVGLIVGVELVRNWRTRKPFDLRERAGIRVCEAMARRGVLTRPIGNVIVIMPPYCTTRAQARRMIGALHDAVVEVFGKMVL